MDRLTWQTVEILGQAYYAEKGFRILISQVEGHVYDFVIETPGGFKSVNVKGATKHTDKNSWYISKRTRETPTPDIYLAFVHEYQRFVELPGELLNDKKTHTITRALFDTIRKEESNA